MSVYTGEKSGRKYVLKNVMTLLCAESLCPHPVPTLKLYPPEGREGDTQVGSVGCSQG